MLDDWMNGGGTPKQYADEVHRLRLLGLRWRTMGQDDNTPAERPGRKHSSQRALDFAQTAIEARDRFIAAGYLKQGMECAQLASRLREWKDVPPGDEERSAAIIRLLELERDSRDV